MLTDTTVTVDVSSDDRRRPGFSGQQSPDPIASRGRHTESLTGKQCTCIQQYSVYIVYVYIYTYIYIYIYRHTESLTGEQCTCILQYSVYIVYVYIHVYTESLTDWRTPLLSPKMVLDLVHSPVEPARSRRYCAGSEIAGIPVRCCIRIYIYINRYIYKYRYISIFIYLNRPAVEDAGSGIVGIPARCCQTPPRSPKSLDL
jgi:hypothetical protein